MYVRKILLSIRARKKYVIDYIDLQNPNLFTVHIIKVPKNFMYYGKCILYTEISAIVYLSSISFQALQWLRLKNVFTSSQIKTN